MNKTVITLYLLVFLLGLITYFLLDLFSCPKIKGAHFSEVISQARDKNYDYCNCLKKAIRGNSDSIVEFSMYQFDSAIGYSHGDNIKALVDKIGESEYLSALEKVDKGKIKIIYINLSIHFTLRMSRSEAEEKMKERYPKLTQFFNKKLQRQ